MQTITSRNHPLIKRLIKLESSAQYRKKSRLTLLDGEHLIQTYCNTVGLPENLIVSESYAGQMLQQAIADKPSTKVMLISDTLFRAVSPVKSPTGILALIEIPKVKPASQPEIFSVLLEDIQDPGNLGSILRSAAAAGVQHAYLSKHCADAWSSKTLRAAMGAHFLLRIHEHCDLPRIAQQFPGTVIATALPATKNLFEVPLTSATAFVFGNEGAGISHELLQAASDVVMIPMPGKTESLNAAVAAAICLFEKVRQDRILRHENELDIDL